jgi:hypothetical protein
MAFNTIRVLSRVSDTNSYELLHLPGKGALLLKDLMIKISEGLKHLLLGLLQVFLMLPNVK